MTQPPTHSADFLRVAASIERDGDPYWESDKDIMLEALRLAAEQIGERIYLDCEFNGWGGELLSLAMVSEDGREFYSVLPTPATWEPWCYDNVRPVLGKAAVESYDHFRLAFVEFLRGFRSPIIIADWPADLLYFNQVLLGRRHEESIAIPCRMQLVLCDYDSAIPHNALEDARAIRSAIERGDHSDAKPVSQWRDMDSAPRDGTRILWNDNETYSVIHWPEYAECFERGVWQPLPAPPTGSA